MTLLTDDTYRLYKLILLMAFREGFKKKKIVEFSTKRGGRGSGSANFPLRKT